MSAFSKRFPRRVRIHGGECGAVARALHHEAKVLTSPAVFEIVSSTTKERKEMSKITFKRIALAVVAALGFGVLSVSPSTAAFTDPNLSLSGQSATAVELNESVTVTIDASWISAVTAGESMTVVVTKTGTADFTATKLIPLATDSQNVTGLGSAATGATNFAYTEIDALLTGGTNPGDNVSATVGATYTRAKWTLRLSKATAAGNATYTVSMRSGNSGYALEKAATGTAAKSLVYLNETAVAYKGATRADELTYLRSDSTIVTSAGTVASPYFAGYLFTEPRNAADTRTATDASRVDATITMNVTGPGSLQVTTAAGATGARAKSVSVSRGDTVLAWSDGTSGTMTITSYVGSVALTQAAKTITFVGFADTFIVTMESSTIIRGTDAAGAISFVAKDSTGNAINGSNTQYRTGYPAGFYLVGSDSTVVGKGATAVDRGAGSTAWYKACTYNSVSTRWDCTVPVTDSGTATVYIADSTTVGSALKTSQALSITVAGTGYTGTMALNKATYNVGEDALLTLTCKDYGGRNIINGSGAACWSNLRWVGMSPTFGSNTSSAAAGGNFGANGLTTYVEGGGTFISGVDTAMAYMPSVAGTYTLVGRTSGATTDSTLLTFTVVDPTQEAQNAAIAAAQAAAVAAANASKAEATAAIAAADAYGATLASDTWEASVSSGAVVGIVGSSTPTCGGTATASTSATGATLGIAVCQATANAPWSGTITVKYAGNTVVTKSATITGDIATIKVSSPKIGKTSGSTYRTFTSAAYDSAGNLVASTPSGISTQYNQYVTAVIPAATVNTDVVTTGNGITCGAKAGTASVAIKATNAAGATITSNTWTAQCGGALDSFKASLDKAVYAPGEIATVTVTGLDSEGKLVYGSGADDNAATTSESTRYNLLSGTTAPVITGGSLDAVVAPSTADYFVNGVKTYQFKVTATEGKFNLSVNLPDSGAAAVTVPYEVKATSASVTNAEVLAAIVKLIASINKQIAALQKALKK